MSFVGANDHPDPVSPQDPLYYAPRSARGIAEPRPNATQHPGSVDLTQDLRSSRFDEMREEAFAKFARPLESQFVYEGRRSRGRCCGSGRRHRSAGLRRLERLAKIEKRALRTLRLDFDARIGDADARDAAIRRIPGAARRIQAVPTDAGERRAGRCQSRRCGASQRSAGKVSRDAG
jgi:hypothetical protein